MLAEWVHGVCDYTVYSNHSQDGVCLLPPLVGSLLIISPIDRISMSDPMPILLCQNVLFSGMIGRVSCVNLRGLDTDL